MLSELIVENVAVIEKAEINFSEGFNVFTGETGAGKSILVDAIYAVLGARTSKNIVRTGTNKATVTAVFENIPLAAARIISENDLGDSDDCILRRDITADGKSSARVNGNPVTVAQLREISESLMSIYGQNDSHDLLNPRNHLAMIDLFGSLQAKREHLRGLHNEFVKLKKELDALIARREETERMRELYEYQVSEIEKANLSETEETELKSRLKLLKNSEKLIKELSGAASLLYRENSPVDAIKNASDSISSVSESDEELKEIAERLSAAYYEVNDCLRAAERYADSFDVSENELRDIEDRLYEIQVILRKYGPDVTSTLGYLAEIKEKLSELYSGDEREGELTNVLREKAVTLKAEAEELSALRKTAAERFLKEVTTVLADLNMKNVRLEASFKEKAVSSSGKDDVEFLISVNAGEEPKPLSKIASGGENSRIMLAIKSVMSDKDIISSMIFDEIDTGVSGSGATKIGEKLKSLSLSKQIICITHQAQIAAMANTHFRIEKNTSNGRTFTTVEKVEGEKRAEEIARIMGGDKFSEELTQSARKMIGIS
jgi:DNA repair protein RecN (Recombination protein N)